MALTAIALCSRALIRIGAGSIAAFDDGTTEAEVAANLYPSVRDAMLSSHPWTFATAQVRLPRLVAEPVADYDYAYRLPADFLRVLSAGAGTKGRGIDYRIVENRLHTHSNEVILSYIFRPDETSFPAFFDSALIARLAAEFCLPLTESTSRAEYLQKQATEDYRHAKLIDAQQDIPASFENYSLIEVRS